MSHPTVPAVTAHDVMRPYGMVDDAKSMLKKKILWASAAIVILTGAIVAVSVFLATKSASYSIPATTQVAEVPRSLVRIAELNHHNGTIRVDSTFSVSDPDTTIFYLTLNITDQSVADTLDDLVVVFTNNATELASGTVSASSYVAPIVQANIKPLQLPTRFTPKAYEYALLADSNLNLLDTAAFRPMVVADDDDADNLANDQNNNNQKDNDDTVVSFHAPILVIPERPPVLQANLAGYGSYAVGGTISIDFSLDLDENGVALWSPFLWMQNVKVPRAPGPFLYLVARPETRPDTIDEGDSSEVLIPVDGTEGSSFTREGTLIQELDETTTQTLVQTYVNGSFVVWCRPFRVYLGGGQIKIVNSTSTFSW